MANTATVSQGTRSAARHPARLSPHPRIGVRLRADAVLITIMSDGERSALPRVSNPLVTSERGEHAVKVAFSKAADRLKAAIEASIAATDDPREIAVEIDAAWYVKPEDR